MSTCRPGPASRQCVGRDHQRPLRLLHHRRLLPDDRRLAGRVPHAHRHGPGCDRDGPLEPGPAPHRAALPRFQASHWPQIRASSTAHVVEPSYSDDEVCVRRFTARISLC